MTTRVCFVQAHHTNLRPDDVDPEGYAIDRLRRSGLFDRIVLAGADLPENRVLRDAAAGWGIDCILGSVDDVVDRMLEVARKTRADVLARVLVDWFYVDTDLVSGMLEKLESEHLDYVNLPYDFDIKFGADVHSVRGLERLGGVFQEHPDLAARYRFRPWFLVEEDPLGLWSVGTYGDVPLYPNERFYALREEIARRSPVAWDFGTSFYYHEYVYAAEALGPTDTVLDLACGWGAGTALLGRHTRRVIGMDIRGAYLRAARRRHIAPNVGFVAGDGLALPVGDATLDAVVSVHTMEHVPDDYRFLEEVRRVLRPGGRLLIEVPLRLRRPFAHNGEPFMLDHVREYAIDDLGKLLASHLVIEERYGVNRGFYCAIEKARNAAAFRCVRPAE